MSAITAGFISSDDYDTTAIQELRRKTPKKRTNEDPFPEDASTQISSFKFRDNSTRENVEIKIHQMASTDYGLFVWPSAKVLAEYIWHIRSDLKNKHVLEIGCGTSLPGILAAACGAKVTLTDREEAPYILNNVKQSILLNNPVDYYTGSTNRVPIFLQTKVLGFTWGKFSTDVLMLDPVDYIIGADCFYDNSEAFEDNISSVVYFMRKNKNLKYITSYQERSSHSSIDALLRKWRLRAKEITLEDFFPFEKYSLANVVRLFEITSEDLSAEGKVVFAAEEETSSLVPY
jgi:predicted nicotinamide N-methyase